MFTLLVLYLFFASGQTGPLPGIERISVANTSIPPASINVVEELAGRRAIHSCEQCGISSVSRIIGGSESAMDEFPWMVQITNDQEFFCGGTLIGKSHVLTAAHCFTLPRNALKVILGAHSLNSKETAVERKVVSVKKHPDFNPNTSKGNDIAILKLDSPVAFDRKVRPLCMPASDQQYIGKNGTVIGWGRTSLGGPVSNDLMKLVLPVVSFDECRDKWYGDTLPLGTLCAGYVYGRKDSCIVKPLSNYSGSSVIRVLMRFSARDLRRSESLSDVVSPWLSGISYDRASTGDSGGPLLAEHNGISYQVGIVSFGASGSCALTYGVYTRVTEFLDWIALNTNDDKCLQK